MKLECEDGRQRQQEKLLKEQKKSGLRDQQKEHTHKEHVSQAAFFHSSVSPRPVAFLSDAAGTCFLTCRDKREQGKSILN